MPHFFLQEKKTKYIFGFPRNKKKKKSQIKCKISLTPLHPRIFSYSKNKMLIASDIIHPIRVEEKEKSFRKMHARMHDWLSPLSQPNSLWLFTLKKDQLIRLIFFMLYFIIFWARCRTPLNKDESDSRYRERFKAEWSQISTTFHCDPCWIPNKITNK